MMTLKDVKDWLKTQVSADVWKIGTYDVSKDKTVCVRNLTSNRSGQGHIYRSALVKKSRRN